jgi:hypothetical protein
LPEKAVSTIIRGNSGALEGRVQKTSERAPLAAAPPRPAEVEPPRTPGDKSRAAPTCIFCDRPSGSTEFAWPEWLCRFLIERHEVHHLQSRGAESDLAMLDRMEREVDTTVSRVCDNCREGWIHRLDEDVKPFLKQMIAGEPTPLPPARQWILARWAAKTAVVLECSLDTPVRTPRAACEHLRNVGVHANTQVLVGCYDGASQVLTYERDLFSRVIDGEQRFFPQASLVIGQVFIQVFAGPWRSGLPELVQHSSQPLLPLVGGAGEDIMWPPASALDDGRYELARFGVLSGGAAWSTGDVRDAESAVSLHD